MAHRHARIPANSLQYWMEIKPRCRSSLVGNLFPWTQTNVNNYSLTSVSVQLDDIQNTSVDRNVIFILSIFHNAIYTSFMLSMRLLQYLIVNGTCEMGSSLSKKVRLIIFISLKASAVNGSESSLRQVKYFCCALHGEWRLSPAARGCAR